MLETGNAVLARLGLAAGLTLSLTTFAAASAVEKTPDLIMKPLEIINEIEVAQSSSSSSEAQRKREERRRAREERQRQREQRRQQRNRPRFGSFS